ncbi:TPA: tail fiber domain-containing protein [Pseudomonas putida]
MAYNSAHSGPKIDAAVQMLGQVQDARDSTGQDLVETKALALEVKNNTRQVAVHADSVSIKTAQVIDSADAVEQARIEVAAATSAAEESKDVAVLSASSAQESQASASASEFAASQSQLAAGISEQMSAEHAVSANESAESAAQDRLAAQESAQRAATSAQNAEAVVTGGTAAIAPSPGKIPLADAQGKIDSEWLPDDVARSAAVAAATEAAAAAAEIADQVNTRTSGFLSPAAIHPAVRNDGMPLQVGDRYLNTGNQTEYLYKSTGWEPNESEASLDKFKNDLSDPNDPSQGAAKISWDGEFLSAQLNLSKKVPNYAALRSYAGPATRFEVTQSGLSGSFLHDPSDSESPETNGIVLVDSRGRRLKREFLGAVYPQWFGAKCDGTLRPLSTVFPTLAEAKAVYPHAQSLDQEIDWAATQAAINYVRSQPFGGKVIFCSGKFVMGSELDCHPAVPVEFEWIEGAAVLTTLLGAASVLFRGTHPVNPATRGKKLVFTNPRIEFHPTVAIGNVGCVFIEHRYASNLKFQGNSGTLLHYRSNTIIRASALFNSDFGPVSLWGGGLQKPWKISSAARYTIALGSTTLRSDIDVFDAADIGKVLTVQGGFSQRFSIATYVDARTVTVTTPAMGEVSAVGGNFETIRGSITSGTKTLLMEKPCLSVQDVGRVVYVLNARTGYPGTALEPLRATIVSVETDVSCTLSAPATATTAGTHVVFSPGAEFFGEDDSSSNDLVLDGFHTEEMRGTCLVITRAGNLSMTNLKLHALNNYYSTSATQFRAVFSSVAGHITGDFEGTCNNALGDVHISGQSGLITFDKMTGTMANDGCLIYAENNSAGAVISVGDWNINNPGITAKTLNNAFRIAGLGDLYQVGRLVAYAFNYTRPDVLKRKTVFGKNPPALTGQAGVASDSSHARFDLIAAGVGNSPLLVGTAYGGNLDAPADAVDFQTMLSVKGQISVASALVDGAGILFRVRSPTGSEASGDMVFYTRSGGAYASRWSIATSGGLLPANDNATPVGSGSSRISQLYAGTATINTSDEREKEEIQGIPDAVLDAWSEVDYQQFKFKDAVSGKGEDARIHVGVIAQRVREAFERHGIDPFSYGVLCFDEWGELPQVVTLINEELDDDGNVIVEGGSMVAQRHRPAGSRYGVRYTEAYALESALLRRTTRRLESRLAALELASQQNP